ncbi:SpoIIE family protein phosphatase [Bacillus daqingensis]|uniref:SpoIIE family protein phosphatase n=1 Tax=Bacillus daqingensis TaxID=872396 RepID=A0ABV9NW44_9BACI
MIEHLHLDDSDISVYHTAKGNNWCSGDSFFGTSRDGTVTCALADGLGSGEEAMHASKLAMEVIESNPDEALERLIQLCNDRMWGTRGVVLSILRIDVQNRRCEYINMGNISCHFYHPDGDMIRPVPKRGYLSGRKVKLRTQSWEYRPGMVFTMYSDGFPQDPLSDRLFSANDTPEAIMDRLSDLFEHVDDDATVMIGKAYV